MDNPGSDVAGLDVDAPESSVTACSGDMDCANARYCDGVERCMPGAPGADARGCIAAASASVCMTGQTCDEVMRRCINAGCANPDMDSDGHRATECGGDDCDDGDMLRYPGRMEVCDAMNRDEDCDPTTFGFRDGDGDGVGDARCCNLTPGADGGARTCGTDCDDSSPTVNPRTSEVCDGVDNDCDGMVDEGVRNTYFRDADGDGFAPDGMSTMSMSACFRPMGYADRRGDCNDDNVGVNPSAPEVCDGAMPPVDENCDGMANPASLCACSGDISRACMLPGACAAGTQRCVNGSYGACSIAPAAETCNGIDDDCDGTVDQMLRITCYADTDNDGYPASGAAMSTACPDTARPSVGGCPSGTTNRTPMGANLDCDAMDSTRFPGALETCDGADRNCNGDADEGLVTCYADADNDGFAAMGAMALRSCPVPGRAAVGGCPANQTNRAPEGATTADCNDAEAGVSPAASEDCDEGSVDENCDGVTNPASLCSCAGSAVRACSVGGLRGACAAGTQTCASGVWGACSIGPASETCNGIDDNCDGTVDETLRITCYADTDNDGFAAAGAVESTPCPDASRPTVGGCPTGTTNRPPTLGNIDCAPSESTRFPGAVEACNGVDQNCNGNDDEGQVPCYPDADNDGFALAASTAVPTCPVPDRAGARGCPNFLTGIDPLPGFADCADNNASRFPTASEVCNGVDNNCNGNADEGQVPCYADADDDGYAAMGASLVQLCPASVREHVGRCPVNYTNNAPTAGFIDCNDNPSTTPPGTGPSIHPGAAEVCDAARVDENCDGMINPGCSCTVGTPPRLCLGASGRCAMGHQACVGGTWGLCDVTPAVEVCDTARVDEDCDGLVNEGLWAYCYTDPDNDGYGAGSPSSFRVFCPDPDRRSVGGCPNLWTNRIPHGATLDCQEDNNAIYPGAPELCSDPPVDNNCSGSNSDEGQVPCYLDGDNDGFAASGAARAMRCPDPLRLTTFAGCPAGYTNTQPLTSDPTRTIDCEPSFPTDHPGRGSVSGSTSAIPAGTEICDRRDNDCDGTVDESGSDVSFVDEDGDGYGSANSTRCVGYLNNVARGGDCNDSNADVRPGQALYFSANVSTCPANTTMCSISGTPIIYRCRPNTVSSGCLSGYATPTRNWDYNCSTTMDRLASSDPTCSGLACGLPCAVSNGITYTGTPSCGATTGVTRWSCTCLGSACRSVVVSSAVSCH